MSPRYLRTHRGSGHLPQALGAMYARELLRASFSLLALAFASFLVESSQAAIPRGWATLLVILVIGGWVLFFWHFFRSTSMSLRQKLVAWLTVAFLFCAAGSSAPPTSRGLSWRLQLGWYGSWLGIPLWARSRSPFCRSAAAVSRSQFHCLNLKLHDHVINVDGA